MSESKQPFTELVTKRKTTWPKGTVGWILVVIIVLLLVTLIGVLSSSQHNQHEVAGLRKQLEDATADLTSAQTKVTAQQQEIAGLRARVTELEKEKEMVAQMARGLEDEMRADLESKDVTISKLQGKLTVNILDRILFDSGEAVVRPDGEGVLQKIATFLTQHPELKIHVIGHTDNVPIKSTARSRFGSNWELSTARALAAVRFLTERAGVAPQRLGAVGYGEFRPIADNATVEGRARNRRIAITILADELAGADTGPTPNGSGQTNLPPGIIKAPPAEVGK